MENIDKNFDQLLEKDIDRLESEIEKTKGSVESDSFEQKEVVKKSFENISNSESITPTSKTKQKSDSKKSHEDEFLPDYMQGDKADNRVKMEVEQLMDIVIHKGILKGLRESKKKSPFIQDAFHDALADKLIPELKNRGILK